jgi:hypothetical protein
LATTTYAEIEDGMFPRPYLAVYKRLAQRLQHNGLNFVLAGYWDTKPLIEASGWTLDVCPTNSNLAVYTWIMNIEWCSKLYRDWSKQKAPLVVFLKTSAERDSFFKENGMPVKVLELRDVESSEAAVYDWSPALDRALKGNVCGAYAYRRMPKPSLC